jgi:hypothetical protein
LKIINKKTYDDFLFSQPYLINILKEWINMTIHHVVIFCFNHLQDLAIENIYPTMLEIFKRGRLKQLWWSYLLWALDS